MIINHASVIALTYIRVRSTWVANAFEWGKTVKMSFEGKENCRKLANGQNIDYSEKKNLPLICLNTEMFKHVYWHI